MAFGFGFNKQKVLSAAEKFVQQVKLQNAIAEYDKILKHDENDLTVNNTIGDLYARLRRHAPVPSNASRRLAMLAMPRRASRGQGHRVMYKKLYQDAPERRWLAETGGALHPAGFVQRCAGAIPASCRRLHEEWRS